MQSLRSPLVAALAVLMACAPELTPEPDGAGEVLGEIVPESRGPIPTNGLRLDPQIAAQLETAPLKSGWAAEFAHSASGREHLEYALICALTPEQTVAFAPELRGYYGLAPEWIDGSCDHECQRWVSACMLAHVNARGNDVSISLRGSRLDFDSVDDGFPLQEAAFYGNLFTGDAQTLEMFACAGIDIIIDTQAAANDYLQGRLCFGPACPIRITGSCSAKTGPIGGACSVELDEIGYEECRGGAVSGSAPLSQTDAPPRYLEVLTVYIAQ